MSIRRILAILLAGLLAACGPKEAPGVVVVPENVAKDTFAAHVSSIELVQLETPGEDFLGQSTKMLLADGNYLLWDAGNKKIQLYGPDGRFLNRVGRSGRGPGEYHTLWNVLYADGKVYVYEDGPDMLVFRPDGTQEGAVKLPVAGGNAFYPLKDGWLGYIGYAYAGKDMVQWIREGKEPVSLIPKAGDSPLAMIMDWPFTEYRGRVFMPMGWGHEVYAYAGGKVEPWLNLDFGRFTIGDSFFSGDVQAAFDILQTRYATVAAYWENERMRVAMISRSEKEDDGKPIPARECIYGICRAGKWVWINAGDNMDGDPFANAISGLDGDALVFLLDPALLSGLDPALRQKVSNAEVLDGLDEEGNYVIAKLRLK